MVNWKNNSTLKSVIIHFRLNEIKNLWEKKISQISWSIGKICSLHFNCSRAKNPLIQKEKKKECIKELERGTRFIKL